eukprot:scaffold43034_cov31-Prasinocladus_malaysianus.AAC.1
MWQAPKLFQAINGKHIITQHFNQYMDAMMQLLFGSRSYKGNHWSCSAGQAPHAASDVGVCQEDCDRGLCPCKNRRPRALTQGHAGTDWFRPLPTSPTFFSFSHE